MEAEDETLLSYRSRVGPVVCCVTTNEVERIVKKNGTDFCGLMQNFTLMPSTQALLAQLTFRSATRHYTLAGGLKVRFLSAETMRPQNLESYEPKLHEAIRCREDEALALEDLLIHDENESKPGATVQILEKRRRNSPWFLRWRQALESSLQYTEYDCFEWPAASLLAVATTEPAGIDAALDELASRRHWPLSYRNSQFESNAAPRHVVLIHDVSENKADANAALASARSLLRAVHCHAASLLPINSNHGQPDASVLFLSHLTETDKKELTRFAGELLHSALVPSIERRLASLHLNVTNARKGVRNVLKSWLRRPREDFGRENTDSFFSSAHADPQSPTKEERVRYPHESIENQIRSLGDAAYAMHDTETAVSAYRLARDDFKSDRAPRHLGAANEMLARTLWTIAKENSDITTSEERHLRRDATQAADAATAGLALAAREEVTRLATANRQNQTAKAPQRIATRAGRMLTRASLVSADVHASWPTFEDTTKSPFTSPTSLATGNKFIKQQDTSGSAPSAAAAMRLSTTNKHRRSPAERAADALVGSAQFETNLNAAVLYEQAAWRFRCGGLYRKCALHLVMAGHRYRACGEDTHALECYAASRDAYAESYRVGGHRSRLSAHKRNDALDHHHLLALFSPQHTAIELLQGQELASSIALMYRPPGWARIDEHVEHALGRQLEALGHHALALRCTLSLLASAKAPPERHAALLSSFVAACVARPEALKRAVEFGSFADTTSSSEFFGGGGETEEAVKAALLAPPLGASSTKPLDNIVVPGLPVPLVLDDAVCLRTPDEATEGRADDRLRWALELGDQLSAEAKAVARGEPYLEDDTGSHASRMALFGQPSREADAARSRAARAAMWPRWCATAEPVEVDVVFRNAFAAPVELNDVHLVCTLDPDHDFGRDPIPVQEITDTVSSASLRKDSKDNEDDTFVTSLRELAAARDRGERLDELYLAERVNVTLPPGGAGSGGSGALVRLRCGAVSAGGTLRVVGVRWRLAHQVWGGHALIRRGPRLFRTRVERARRSRALDASLALHVIGDAPRLEARLAVFNHKDEPKWLANSALAPRGGAETLLHGQTRRGCLELRNTGRASASGVLVRCSGPWLALGPAQTEIEDCATGARLGNLASALGSSGLLWRAVTQEKQSLTLSPGESCALPIILRARGAGGKEPLRLVVQYEPTRYFVDSISPEDIMNATPRATPAYVRPPRLWPEYGEHDPEKPDIIPARSQRAESLGLARRAPLALDVCVLPALSAAVAPVVRHASRCAQAKKCNSISGSLAPDSLEIVASASPISDEPEQSILALQLTNYRSAGPITVLAVRILDEDAAFGAFDIFPLELGAKQQSPSTRSVRVTVNKAIGWNEQLVLQLRVARASQRSVVPSAEQDDDPAMDLLRVECKRTAFEKSRILKDKSNDKKGASEPRSIASIRRERQATATSAAAVGPGKPKPHTNGALNASTSISLLVEWEATDDNYENDDEFEDPTHSALTTNSTHTTKIARRGQQHILHIPILDRTSLETCPVALALEYPAIAAASFVPHRKAGTASSAPILVPPRVAVPVKIRIVYRAPPGSAKIAAKLELFDDNHLDLRWLGKKSFLFKMLEPGDTHSGVLETEVSVTRPGIYDLNRIRCTVYDGIIPDLGADPANGRMFAFDIEHLLEVRDVNASTASASSGWGPVERDELLERLLNIPSSSEKAVSRLTTNRTTAPLLPVISRPGGIASSTAPLVVPHGPPRPTTAIPLPPGVSAASGTSITATIVQRPPTGLAAAPPVASRRQVPPATATFPSAAQQANGPLLPRKAPP